MLGATAVLLVRVAFEADFIYSQKKNEKILKPDSLNTALKVSKYVIFSGPYFPVCGLNKDQKKNLRIWTLSTL